MNVIIRVIFVIYGIRMALLDSVNYLSFKILYFWRKLYLLQIYRDFIYLVL